MSLKSILLLVTKAAGMTFCLILYACDSPSASNRRIETAGIEYRPYQSPQNASEQARLPLDARPAAIINGRSVFWSDLRHSLVELSGGLALQELILDRQITRALKNAGIQIGATDIDRERKLLTDNLSDDPNLAVRLLNELRRNQKLGDTRFPDLLMRNAALRALIRGQVQITEADLRQTFELLYGEKRQGRLIITQSLADAGAALKKIEQGSTFMDVAVELSTDSSSARGGLLAPISREDEGYPLALRESLWKLSPGDISPPILLENRYGLLQLVRVIEPMDEAFDQNRVMLQRLTRLNKERLLMEQQADRLLINITMHFFDKTLENSYREHVRSNPKQDNP